MYLSHIEDNFYQVVCIQKKIKHDMIRILYTTYFYIQHNDHLLHKADIHISREEYQILHQKRISGIPDFIYYNLHS